MKKVALGVLLILSLMLMVVGCKSEEESVAPEKSTSVEESATAEEKDEFVIAASFQNLQNEFVLNIQDAMVAEAESMEGVKLVTVDGEGNPEKQVTQIENFITQGVDAIILNPFDKDLCMPAVLKANEAGIPIVIVNAQVADLSLAQGFCGSNDVDAGIIAASHIAELLEGKGNVYVIKGPLGHSAEIARSEGIISIFDEYEDINIIAEKTANWDRAEGMSVMENWINTGDEINAIVAQNDEMALGAYKAIEAAGLEKEILVIGIDAIPDALKSVKNGEMVATVFQDSAGQGVGALRMAFELAKGNEIDHDEFIPFQLIIASDID